MTNRVSVGVIVGNVLAERFITQDAEQLAVRDAAKGFRAFTSKANDVPLTGVDLFLAPESGNSLQANTGPSDDSVGA